MWSAADERTGGCARARRKRRGSPYGHGLSMSMQLLAESPDGHGLGCFFSIIEARQWLDLEVAYREETAAGISELTIISPEAC